jgi:hypothetical protein
MPKAKGKSTHQVLTNFWYSSHVALLLEVWNLVTFDLAMASLL